MCGVAGYAGLSYVSQKVREDLVEALGIGIDQRGGHASGFVRVTATDIRCHRKLGEWSSARMRFIRAAAEGTTLMMHARFATTGRRDDILNAHPFPIVRNGRTVLYGAHNGMLEGTWGSATEHGRDHTVDSREFLELLADQDYEAIRNLEGYGVVTYVQPTDGIIRVVRISRDSDLVVYRLKGGGILYASTAAIAKDAADYAGLLIERELPVNRVGQVYRLVSRVEKDKLSGIEVESFWGQYASRGWDWENEGGICYTTTGQRVASEPTAPESEEPSRNDYYSMPDGMTESDQRAWREFFKKNNHLLK